MDDVKLTMVGLTARVANWVHVVLGYDCLMNRRERALRLIEEAIELGQVEGLSRSDVVKVTNRVFDRPVGEREQEVGGIGVCLLAYCYAAGIDFKGLTERELRRIEKLDPNIIRAKHAAKAEAGTAIKAIPPDPAP